MLALDLYSRVGSVSGAGVRKPPKKEPAGAGEWLAVYGDLIGQRLGRERRWPPA